jgi:hypothetical protein
VFPQEPGRPAFDELNKPMNTVLWVHINEQVDVIGHDFQLQQLCSYVSTDLGDNGLERHVNPIDQDRTAVLGTPDDVIFTGIHDVVIRFVRDGVG